MRYKQGATTEFLSQLVSVYNADARWLLIGDGATNDNSEAATVKKSLEQRVTELEAALKKRNK